MQIQKKNNKLIGIDDEGLFPCKVCGKHYKTKALLDTHIKRVHCEAANECPYCQRKFKQKHHMNDHVKSVHEGIRPYQCRYCDRSFGLPKTLRVHLMGHTNERPYQCDVCEKTFIQITDLKRHQKNHWSDPQIRCPICSQGNSSQTELTEHLARHSNRDGYQCNKCGLKFTKLFHLKNHDDAVHLKLRPFKYDFNDCCKTFAARKTLRMHQLTHAGNNSTICNTCDKKFSSKSSY